MNGKEVLEAILERCDNFKQGQLSEIEYYKSQIEHAQENINRVQKEIDVLTQVLRNGGF